MPRVTSRYWGNTARPAVWFYHRLLLTSKCGSANEQLFLELYSIHKDQADWSVAIKRE